MSSSSSNLRGVGFLVLAMLIFSLQDIAVKGIGGNYSVMEIVTLRSIVAMPCTLLLFRLEGRRGWPTSAQPRLEYLRGTFLFLSYTTHFMGLAALPLAEIAAIKFSGPLMITLLAVFLLGELVGPRRWLALLVGFAGVLLIVQPGTASFNLGSLFVLLSVLFYALSVIVTRQLKTTDSSATMATTTTAGSRGKGHAAGIEDGVVDGVGLDGGRDGLDIGHGAFLLASIDGVQQVGDRDGRDDPDDRHDDQ